jgi:hypothetical protein
MMKLDAGHDSLNNWKGRQMNRLLIPALGLAGALFFSVPAFHAAPAEAAVTTLTSSTSTDTMGATTKKKVSKTHTKKCKSTKKHKCPVTKKKKKKK